MVFLRQEFTDWLEPASPCVPRALLRSRCVRSIVFANTDFPRAALRECATPFDYLVYNTWLPIHPWQQIGLVWQRKGC